ncbi:MAG: acetylglutamate kinase [Ardenticatenaceae bacterium]|nr:acetylglutamate kinase [Ardenticatenaceae bacterium]
MRVIKISGHDLDNPAFLSDFAAAVAKIAAAEPVVIINGGGKSIKQLQDVFGIPEEKIDGLRVTNAQSLWITEMVMSAAVNKLLVRALRKAGLDALGVSGVDGQLLKARKKVAIQGDLGFVGEIIGVRVELLRQMLDWGLTPVISPVSADEKQQQYNVNADEAATAVAAAAAAEQLDFVSNVPGVLRDLNDNQVIPALTPAEVDALLADGTINGGMVPKVKAAVGAVTAGVQQARIVNLEGIQNGGTLFKGS